MGGAQDEIRRLMKEAKQKPSAATTPVPAGFFDDSLADAKARNVDVKQLAEKQLESEWEAFLDFAAEVEQQSVQADETKEREAVEQLENMEYVDRYRVALERATSLRSGNNKPKTEKRKLDTASDVVKEDDETEGTNAVLSEYKKKHKKAKKKHSDIEDSDDDFDSCNWRSRGI
ncbi:uncharacterized protein PITG_06407 [Phytophthora infestans T30-4]|uniref:ZNF380 coiled-coil domain-containing protein n=1 Tax=Phytophthora infestans (strain T30-4) TaxID=403677 RepID=D0N4T0_PHYIT|nr:uncharacterized protein PITG_06407 [Phytophthora infestans T30-4]EEY69888.1 conserved hypothetical protein [Phytophthora infestans T30-4]|eukprot:XP_002998535.1 conserved hypothetical protein [Phytophthora infestans T30-4]